MTLALDLDGTLISCRPRQSAVLRAALIAGHQTVDVDAVWAMKREGDSTRSALQRCGLSLSAANAVGGFWEQWVEQPYWLGFDFVLEGVRETLTSWRASGLELMLVTARSRPEWIVMQLCHLHLSHFFTRVEVVTPASASESKAAILRRHRLLAFVGDTETDANAARAAELSFIGVASGQRSADFLRRIGVLQLAETLAEVRF